MPVCVFIIAIFIDEEMKEVCVITPKVTQPVRNSTWIQIGPFFCFFFLFCIICQCLPILFPLLKVLKASCVS